MKTLVLKYIVPAAAFVGLLSLLSACGTASKLDKVRDYSVRYELAKQYYAQGHYNRAAETIGDIVTVLKGTEVSRSTFWVTAVSKRKATPPQRLISKNIIKAIRAARMPNALASMPARRSSTPRPNLSSTKRLPTRP